jgi:hypothetical protein
MIPTSTRQSLQQQTKSARAFTKPETLHQMNKIVTKLHNYHQLSINHFLKIAKEQSSKSLIEPNQPTIHTHTHTHTQNSRRIEKKPVSLADNLCSLSPIQGDNDFVTVVFSVWEQLIFKLLLAINSYYWLLLAIIGCYWGPRDLGLVLISVV